MDFDGDDSSTPDVPDLGGQWRRLARRSGALICVWADQRPEQPWPRLRVVRGGLICVGVHSSEVSVAGPVNRAWGLGPGWVIVVGEAEEVLSRPFGWLEKSLARAAPIGDTW